MSSGVSYGMVFSRQQQKERALLGSVTSQRLVNAAEREDLACAIVKYKVCEIAIVL
jgi:hypothetical protein